MFREDEVLEIDSTDRLILEILQNTGRMTNRELAKKVGLSPAPCWHRVKRLEQTGMINHYVAVLDNKLAGQHFRAMVGVNLVSRSNAAREDFENRVAEMANVLACHQLSADVEYHLFVTAADQDALDEFLENTLLAIPGLSHAYTRISLKEIKRSSALPLDAIAEKLPARGEAAGSRIKS